MDDGSDINWTKPVTNKQFIVWIIFFFLVGGFILGFAVGGHTVQSNWENYNTDLQERISQECICTERFLPCGDNITLGGLTWD